MKRTEIVLATLAAAVTLWSQTTPPPGTVVFNPPTTENIIATAGGLVCTIQPVGSAPYSEVSGSCTFSGTAFLTFTATPLVAGAQGETVQANAGGNAITAIFTQTAAGAAIGYNVAATPTGGTTGTKTGNF